jgi:hypothetical protein
MIKATLILCFLSIFMGCSTNMTEVKNIADAIEKSSTVSEEIKQLDLLVQALQKDESSIVVSVYKEKMEVPIQQLPEIIDDELIIHIAFSDGSKFEWKPKDNGNIYILLRE